MKKFKTGQVVRCFGSKRQFLCYGVIKDESADEPPYYPPPYYLVHMYKDKDNVPTVTHEDVYEGGGGCFREDEMEPI